MPWTKESGASGNWGKANEIFGDFDPECGVMESTAVVGVAVVGCAVVGMDYPSEWSSESEVTS